MKVNTGNLHPQVSVGCQAYTFTHIHTFIHTYKHTYIHTYVCVDTLAPAGTLQHIATHCNILQTHNHPQLIDNFVMSVTRR